MAKDDNRQSRATSQALLSLGTLLAGGVLFFAGLGYYIDRRRGGGSAFTLIGLCLGLLSGGYEIWKVVRALEKEDAKKPPGDAPP